MEYTLADLDAIYREHESMQLQDSVQLQDTQLSDSVPLQDSLQDSVQLQPSDMTGLFDFGDIKDDMILDRLDGALDDPDSLSSGRLVIDHKLASHDTELEESE